MLNLRKMMAVTASDELAERLLKCWAHDEGSLMFWRASSNFVYAFRYRSDTYFLRFSSDDEHSSGQIEAELAFMIDLQEQGYPTVQPVLSMNGRLIETAETDDGAFYAVVFRRAAGAPMVLDFMEDHQYVRWGRSLARLHALSKSYRPEGEKRKDWRTILNGVRTTLQRFPEERDAWGELERMESWLAARAQNADTYGLVHYDFQPDNVYWDEQADDFQVFDFDDSAYHWFAMDIAAALIDLFGEEVPDSAGKIALFLRGYRSVFPLDEQAERDLPTFLRFLKLHGFARLLRSLENSEPEEDAPFWYRKLNTKYEGIRDRIRTEFRQPWLS